MQYQSTIERTTKQPNEIAYDEYAERVRFLFSCLTADFFVRSSNTRPNLKGFLLRARGRALNRSQEIYTFSLNNSTNNNKQSEDNREEELY